MVPTGNSFKLLDKQKPVSDNLFVFGSNESRSIFHQVVKSGAYIFAEAKSERDTVPSKTTEKLYDRPGLIDDEADHQSLGVFTA